MPSRKQDLAAIGESAYERVQKTMWTVRKKLAAWRDPRAWALRARRRAKRTTVTTGTMTVSSGAASAIAYYPEIIGAQFAQGTFAESMLDLGGFGLTALAFVFAAGFVGSARRYRRLMREPLPDPAPQPVELPPPGSLAREPMQRLRDAELSLHQTLNQLSSYGADSNSDVISHARATAAAVASGLRELGERLRAVETALPHTPVDQRAEIQAEIQRMREELDEGVRGYGSLVAAAVKSVAAAGTPQQQFVLQDATDRLAGLAAGLRELRE